MTGQDDVYKIFCILRAVKVWKTDERKLSKVLNLQEFPQKLSISNGIPFQNGTIVLDIIKKIFYNKYHNGLPAKGEAGKRDSGKGEEL